MIGTENFDAFTIYGGRGTSQTWLIKLRAIWRDRITLRAVIDDTAHGGMHPALGVPAISGEERLERFADLPVLMTIGDCAQRARVCARLVEEGAIFATAICRQPEMVAPNAVIGAGSAVMPYSMIGPDVVLGAGVQVMANLVAHDVTVGDFTTLGHNAVILGHVDIGEGVHIAPGAIISNGTPEHRRKIGDGASIGVGAVVMRDVAPGERMIGNPAVNLLEWPQLKRLMEGRTPPPQD